MKPRSNAGPRPEQREDKPAFARKPGKDKAGQLAIPMPDPVNEQVVIAAALVDLQQRKKLVAFLPPDTFYAPGHPEAWEVIGELERRGLAYDPATVQQLSNGKVDSSYLDSLIEQRPAVPPNLAHHVEVMRWDRARVEGIRGPVQGLLDGLRDPLTSPETIRAQAKKIAGAFDGYQTQSYLRDPEQLKREVMAGIRKRRGGAAVYPTGLPGFDMYGPEDPLAGRWRLIPALAPEKFTVITGVPGCLAGDTMIELNRAGKSFKLRLSEVVRRFRGGVASGKVWAPEIATMVRVRAADGRIRLGLLADAYESGTKQTFEIVTESGRCLRATADHRFLTSEGWAALSTITPGMYLHVDGGKQKHPRKAKAYYHYTHVPGHPHAIHKAHRPTQRQVATHRLVMEAALNKLTLEAFCAAAGVGAPGLVFLDPTIWAVHHRDENTRNNSPDNLVLMTHKEHYQLHADGGRWLALSVLERVVAITSHGEEPTYDLALEDEPHNFLANGFVVHNSAKTTVTAQIALAQVGDYNRRVLYGAWEQGAELTMELMASQSLGISRTSLSTGDITDEQEAAIEAEIDRLSPWVRFCELPFGRKKGEKIINDRSLDLLHEMIATSGADVAIFDLWRRALGQLDPDEEEQALYRQQAIGQETKCHQILLHQLRMKDVESRDDKRPTRESIKGSGAWIEVPDNIFGIHRDALFKDVPDTILQIHVMKQRFAKFPMVVDFDWDPDIGWLTNGRSATYERPGQSGTGEHGSGLDSFLAAGPGGSSGHARAKGGRPGGGARGKKK